MTRGPMMMLLLFAALSAAPARPFPGTELPPDFTHISSTGCRLRQFAVDTMNAQTKVADELHYVEVIGFVKFERTPGNEERVEWTVSLGTYPSPDADTVPKETVDRCVSWKKKLREAIVEDQHRRGHSAR